MSADPQPSRVLRALPGLAVAWLLMLAAVGVAISWCAGEPPPFDARAWRAATPHERMAFVPSLLARQQAWMGAAPASVIEELGPPTRRSEEGRHLRLVYVLDPRYVISIRFRDGRLTTLELVDRS